MCLIVDANAASEMFSRPPSAEAMPAAEWIFSGTGALVIGGQLTGELNKVGNAARALTELKRAGRAHEIRTPIAEAETLAVAQTGLCVSDDPHIIALARLSGTRVLFSHDTDLHKDFTNKSLVDNPRGRIYQDASHKRLLKHTATCPRGRDAARR